MISALLCRKGPSASVEPVESHGRARMFPEVRGKRQNADIILLV